ncbi:hypothetical protein SNOG_11647 [Parastagonospora nodorum SN15]|uniref:Uncharacterized protein n=1 Tax=Phaeosphaeria nodorum (strain SN15 / ATCC MYA-4574 / FGSC 10173) TaxID=321614 RepID=Q0U9B7_PHANO|nr:hypothetical protein SNOG_11647 [Parastagonospora nodorum SN15]EAT80691.1 hypothetical protein SNOG_11647 [Parastagonospora nodorum SN15]
MATTYTKPILATRIGTQADFSVPYGHRTVFGELMTEFDSTNVPYYQTVHQVRGIRPPSRPLSQFEGK